MEWPSTATLTPLPPTPTPFAVVCAGDEARLTLERVIRAPTEADIFLAFDSTSSMDAVLGEMQRIAATLLADVGGQFADARFGIATIADYPFEPYGTRRDKAWRLVQPLTSDLAAVRRGLDGITLSLGFDQPEAYARAVFEAGHRDNALEWSDTARRLLIVLGDSFPHDDDLNAGIDDPPLFPGDVFRSGYPPTFLDPGRSADAGSNADTSDDIDWQTSLDALSEAEITLLSVHASDTELDESEIRLPIAYWEAWAARTGPGGRALSLASASDVGPAVRELVEGTSRNFQRVEVRAAPVEYQGWLAVAPDAYRDVTIGPGGAQVRFDVTLRVPQVVPPGEYSLYLRIVGDGAELYRERVTLSVVPPCATPQTLTPSATPSTPTATPSPTVPGSQTPAKPTPTATTATAVPKRVYLPYLSRSSCAKRSGGMDIALILDTSSSMGSAVDSGGVTKLEGAVKAASTFIDLMEMPPDRASIVVFNSEAGVAVDLTTNRTRLTSGLYSLRLGEGTRIDLGLIAAGQALGSLRDRRAAILLTDGQPTGTDRTAVEEAADRLRADGVLLYAVGIGPDVDAELLARLAEPQGAFHATDPEALSELYRTLAIAIPCR